MTHPDRNPAAHSPSHETPAFSLSRRRLLGASLGAATALGAGVTLPLSAAAQTWPSGPVKFILPAAAGGGSDTVARVIGSYLGTAIGQPVVVENIVGANGIIGTETASRARPDGQTLLVGSNATHGTLSGMMKKLPYDPVKDFIPVAPFGTFLFALVVNPDVPVKTMAELVRHAKANPGKLSYAAPTSTATIMAETLKRGTGIDILQVPYRGVPQALPDLAEGRVSMSFMDLATLSGYLQQGKVRVLAITSRERSTLFPDIPTIHETVMPGYAIEAWTGLFAPAGTPQPIVDRLNAEVRTILAMPEVKARFVKLAYEVRIGQAASVQAFRDFVPAEVEKFTNLVKAAGIEPQ